VRAHVSTQQTKANTKTNTKTNTNKHQHEQTMTNATNQQTTRTNNNQHNQTTTNTTKQQPTQPTQPSQPTPPPQPTTTTKTTKQQQPPPQQQQQQPHTQNKTIKGAALDVFENEPNIREDFLSLPNTLLLPHVGSATKETREGMAKMVVDNLLLFFDGKPLLSPVPECC